jgi:hypothetical protein
MCPLIEFSSRAAAKMPEPEIVHESLNNADWEVERLALVGSKAFFLFLCAANERRKQGSGNRRVI